MPAANYLDSITSADLSAKLAEYGCVLAPGVNADSKILAAADRWEIDTGWRPFLSTGAPEDKYFDGNDDFRLLSKFGIIEIASVTIDDAEVSADDYWLELPRSDGDAFLAIAFTFPVRQWRRNVVVNATYGFCSVLPEWAKDAILCGAAHSLIRGNQGDLTRIKEGPVEYQYAESRVSGIKSEYDMNVARCRFPEI